MTHVLKTINKILQLRIKEKIKLYELKIQYIQF
jgi:hypothetical protein